MLDTYCLILILYTIPKIFLYKWRMNCLYRTLHNKGNCLVNPSIKPDIVYSIGCVTKQCFSSQQNQPFQEDVSYCLRLLYVIVRVLVQSNAPFSDPPMSCRTLCWPPNCRLLITVLPQGNAKFHFEFFTAFLMVAGPGGAWQSCGNRWELLQQAKV
jgi:hypothetical protein